MKMKKLIIFLICFTLVILLFFYMSSLQNIKTLIYINLSKESLAKISTFLGEEIIRIDDKDKNRIILRTFGDSPALFIRFETNRDPLKVFYDNFVSKLDSRFEFDPINDKLSELEFESQIGESFIICQYGTKSNCKLWYYVTKYNDTLIHINTPNSNEPLSQQDFISTIKLIEELILATEQ